MEASTLTLMLGENCCLRRESININVTLIRAALDAHITNGNHENTNCDAKYITREGSA